MPLLRRVGFGLETLKKRLSKLAWLSGCRPRSGGSFSGGLLGPHLGQPPHYGGRLTAGLLYLFLIFQGTLAFGAPSIFVHATTKGDVLSNDAFQSVVWHELQANHQHEAKFVHQINLAVLNDMRRKQVTSLLELHVKWQIDVVRLDNDRVTGGYFPTITAREWAIQGNQLVALKEWTTAGTVALYAVNEHNADELISIPEISLQQATEVALYPIEAPSWTQNERWVRVPVEVYADDEYRAFYGEHWPTEVQKRIDRANALLRPAGLMLDVEHLDEWNSSSNGSSLSQLLDQVRNLPREHPERVRIGFTQQTELAQRFHRDVEDVGRAYLPGRDLIIADQALAPGHNSHWDIAEEGIAIAHEVLHTLGVPHEEKYGSLMSAAKSGVVHQMTPGTIELARAAASARYGHWDPNVILDSLSDTAAKHLKDPALQVEFIAQNYAWGQPDQQVVQLEPKRLSALSNLALGHYYLRQAIEHPKSSGAYTSQALAHTESALEHNPSWVSASELRATIMTLRVSKTTDDSEADPNKRRTEANVCVQGQVNFGLDQPTCH